MKRTLLILLICAQIIPVLFSQTTVYINEHQFEAKKSINFVSGISGFKTTNYELGLGLNFWETRLQQKIIIKPFVGGSVSAIFYSENMNLKGYELNVWVDGLIVLGVSGNYHFNDEFKTYGLKPFLGFGVYGFTFTYGFNVFLNKNYINELSHHNFSVRYNFPILKFKK